MPSPKHLLWMTNRIALSCAHLIQEPLNFFFFFWTNMSHKKNKHRIKVLPWSDFFPPQRLPSHTRWTLTAHILHTHARVLIPLFRQQNGEQRPPRALKSHTLSIFHTNGAYSHWNSLPFGIHNMHRTLLKPVLFDGEMEAMFSYLQRFHLNRTATAPTAGRRLMGCTMFWFTNDPDSLQMWVSATQWHHGLSELEPSLSKSAVLTLLNSSLAPLYLD